MKGAVHDHKQDGLSSVMVCISKWLKISRTVWYHARTTSALFVSLSI